jgi:hypothetical protein
MARATFHALVDCGGAGATAAHLSALIEQEQTSIPVTTARAGVAAAMRRPAGRAGIPRPQSRRPCTGCDPSVAALLLPHE